MAKLRVKEHHERCGGVIFRDGFGRKYCRCGWREPVEEDFLRKRTNEMIAEAHKAYEEGLSIPEIADKLKVDHNRAWTLVKKRKVK